MKAIRFLKDNPGFRLVWTTRLVSSISDVLMATAILLHFAGGKGSGTAVGFVLLAQTTPRIFGPIYGSIVDRMDMGKLLLVCQLAKISLLFGLFLTVDHRTLASIAIGFLSLFSSIEATTVRSIFPSLVNRDDFATANALNGLVLNASLALGPIMGALLFDLLAIEGVLISSLLLFFLSFLLVRRLPHLVGTGRADVSARGSYWDTLRLGLSYLKQNEIPRAISTGLFMSVFFAAIGGVALVFLLQDVLGATPTTFGFISSAHGIGMVLGPLIALQWAGGILPRNILLIGIGLMAFSKLMTGNAPTIELVFVAQIISGIGNGLQNLGNDTILQRFVPKEYLGRVFGTVYSFAHLAAMLSYMVAGPLIDRTSPRVVYNIMGVGILLALIAVGSIVKEGSGRRMIFEPSTPLG